MNLAEHDELIRVLRNGGTAVIRTDTVYGLVASADHESAVQRVYDIKRRDNDKSCIVLIADAGSLYDVPDILPDFTSEVPTSYLLDAPGAPTWLRRHDDTLAYRVPRRDDLRELLRLTGPLIAPSANPQGSSPARTIAEAQAYFRELVDLYVDGGTVPRDVAPSRLVRLLADGTVERLR